MKKTHLLCIFVLLFSCSGLSKSYNFNAKRLLRDSSINIQSGKKAVFIFMSSGCPCSRGFTAYMNKMVREHEKNFNFYIVVSNANEDWNMSKKYFSKFGFTVPIIKDDRAAIANHFGAMKTPHVFVVSENAEIIYSGGITDRRMIENAKTHYLKEVLASIKAKKKPKWSKTRALGCYIPREKV